MLKKFKLSPVKTALLLTIVLIIWLALGVTYKSQDNAPQAQVLPEKTLTHVEVKHFTATTYQTTIVSQGQILPWREVDLKAQQAGRVDVLLKDQGDSIKKGDKLLRLSDEGRTALLSQAKANLTLRQKELESAQSLAQAKYVSPTEKVRFESEFAKAEAEFEQASLALSQTQPEAPFDGLVDRKYVETGDFVQTGTQLMRLVQIDKLKVTANIPQQNISQIKIGQTATLTLLDGTKMQGELSFISYLADNATRSFYIEITTANPNLLRIAGSSVTVEVLTDKLAAHNISPALLSLNATGDLQVATVDSQKNVSFYPVKVLSIDNSGAWVSGLPESVNIITQGAGFVKQGEMVSVSEVNP